MKRLTNGSLSSTVVGCPLCKEVVSGHRFAPHLEKCMNGGKRGGLVPVKKTSTAYSNSNIGIGLPYQNISKKIDNYPQSLVVRVRLKDGGEVSDSINYLHTYFNLLRSYIVFIYSFFCL